MSDDTKRKAHILVAEDDDGTRETFVQLLEWAGYNVTAVADGARAHSRIKQGDIDAVLSDIGMPGLNGLQLLESVGADENSPPMVLITGNAALDTALAAFRNRAVDYLVKPATDEAILGAVKKAVAYSLFAKQRRNAARLLASENDKDVPPADEHLHVENAIRTMWMAFQPIVSLRERRVYSYEALVRNEDPNLRAPDKFIKAASRQGRMRELSTAIRWSVAKTVPTAPASTLFFVNLIAPDLLDEFLYDPLAPLSLVAKRVVLEITERDSLEHVQTLEKRIADLRAIGYRVAVDDLGAGNSNLNSLLDLRPDVVKVDMKLVRGIDTDAQRRGIVGGLQQICDGVGFKMVAEGVETLAELTTLNALGVDLIQGYYFGKPSKDLVVPEERLYPEAPPNAKTAR